MTWCVTANWMPRCDESISCLRCGCRRRGHAASYPSTSFRPSYRSRIFVNGSGTLRPTFHRRPSRMCRAEHPRPRRSKRFGHREGRRSRSSDQAWSRPYVEHGPVTLAGAFNALTADLRRPVEILGLLHLAVEASDLEADRTDPDDDGQHAAGRADEFEVFEAIRPDGARRRFTSTGPWSR